MRPLQLAERYVRPMSYGNRLPGKLFATTSSSPKPRMEKVAHFSPGALRRVAVVGERHSHDLPPGAELRQVECVGRARIDDQLDNARRLPLGQRRAIGGGRHVVLCADEAQSPDGERRVRL